MRRRANPRYETARKGANLAESLILSQIERELLSSRSYGGQIPRRTLGKVRFRPADNYTLLWSDQRLLASLQPVDAPLPVNVRLALGSHLSRNVSNLLDMLLWDRRHSCAC